jgi:hypothetical protein
MKDLLDRNKAGAFLQPWERGLLKLVKYLLVAAVVSALPVIFMYVQNLIATHPEGIDWASALKFSSATFLMALATAFLKWIQSHFDANNPLVQATATLVEDANQMLRVWGGVPNDTKIEPVLDPTQDPGLPFSAEPPADPPAG